jgi:protein O-GlcNAc transferase
MLKMRYGRFNHSLFTTGAHLRFLSLYRAAVHHKSDFDLALVNLGNSIKDMVMCIYVYSASTPGLFFLSQGCPWDAIEYFERAIAVNPQLPEAICGLSNAKNALCDWRGRGTVGGEVGADEDGRVISTTQGHPGWIRRVVDIVEAQLDASYSINTGLVTAMGDVEFWIDWVEKAMDTTLSAKNRARWRKTFDHFATDFDRGKKKINEGGFIIRFVEWTSRRIQKKWYKDLYGHVVASAEQPSWPSTPEDMSRYTWLRFHSSFIPITVPSALPFHTFEVPFSCRMARLISHR